MKLASLTYVVLLVGSFSCTGDTVVSAAEVDLRAGGDSEIRIAVRTEPTGLNPILNIQSTSRYVYDQIFQTLNDHDAETFALIPLLASVPEVRKLDNGGNSLTYQLDSLASWPDGSPVTAADVIFSLKAVLNPLVSASNYRPYYEMVSDVVVDPTDDRRFSVHTERPYILADQALGDLYVYPEYAYDPDTLLRSIDLGRLARLNATDEALTDFPSLAAFASPFNSARYGLEPDLIVGSGPYRLQGWEPGRSLSLRKREGYWAAYRNESQYVAEPDWLTFEIISDPGATVNALRDELVDVAMDLPEDIFLQLRDDEYLNGLYRFEALPSFRYFSILLNQDDPLMADSLTRRALAMTVDVDRIVDQLLPGLADRLVGPVLPSKEYYNKDLPLIPYDLQRASTLLRQAGWEDADSDGILDRMLDGERRPFRFELLSSASPMSEAVCLVVAQGARQVGIDVRVVRRETNAFYASLNAGQFTASFYGQGLEPSLDDFSQAWLSTSIPPAGINRGSFSSPQADSLIRQIAVTEDERTRTTLYLRLQEIIYDSQPMIFLYAPYARVVVAQNISYELSAASPNLRFNALRRFENTSDKP